MTLYCDHRFSSSYADSPLADAVAAVIPDFPGATRRSEMSEIQAHRGSLGGAASYTNGTGIHGRTEAQMSEDGALGGAATYASVRPHEDLSIMFTKCYKQICQVASMTWTEHDTDKA
jgi:hypothetical protein